MRQHLLRAATALTLATAFAVPYTAPLGCGGDMCCDMQMAEQAHHGTAVTVTASDASSPCPMLGCGVVSSALTIEYGAVVPAGSVDGVATTTPTLSYTSTSLPPHTPPPRA
jgi:hypothetical protein